MINDSVLSHSADAAPVHRIQPTIRGQLSSRVWLAAYETAEARDAHIALARHLRAALACVVLACLAPISRRL